MSDKLLETTLEGMRQGWIVALRWQGGIRFCHADNVGDEVFKEALSEDEVKKHWRCKQEG